MRIAKSQLEALDKAIALFEGDPKVSKHLRALKARLNKATVKVASGIGWERAANAMKEVLGKKLVLPPNPGEQWMIYMSKRIRDLGLTENDCRKIANNMADRWNRSTYGFEFAIKQADMLLVSTSEGNTKSSESPADMDDWE